MNAVIRKSKNIFKTENTDFLKSRRELNRKW